MQKIRFIFAIFAGLCLTILSTGQLSAKTITGDVRAGKSTQIYSFVSYNAETCATSTIPKLGTVKVDNGKITSRVGRVQFDSGRCKGKYFNALQIFYKSKSGFRGEDKASIILITNRYVGGFSHSRRSNKVIFKLNVK